MSIYAILSSKPHNPHYLNRYIRFIEGCQKVNEGFEGYTEKHHICPKSLFPEYESFTKNPWNKAVLTARQHFIAHWILWKAYPGNESMLFAFYSMNNKDGNRLNSRIYEVLKEERSKSASVLNKRRIENGTHNWLDKEKARERALRRIADGTHHFTDSSYQSNLQKRRIENGSHNWQGDGTLQRNMNLKRVADGTHPWLGGEVQRENNRRRIADGTHHWLDKEAASKRNKKRVEDGTHPFLGGDIQRETQQKLVRNGTHHCLGTVSCINREGKTLRVKKEIYYAQTGPIEDREYVHFNTKEGKRRKTTSNMSE